MKTPFASPASPVLVMPVGRSLSIVPAVTDSAERPPKGPGGNEVSLRPVVAILVAVNIVVWGGLFAFEGYLASESAAITATPAR